MNTWIRMRFVALPVLMWLTIALSGCGAPSCTFVAIKIDPQTATVDHNAPPPANGLQFSVIAATTPPGCGVMHSNPESAAWSVSDSAHVSISNVHDHTFGVASCVGSTIGPVKVTATMPSAGGTVSGTAVLTCQ